MNNPQSSYQANLSSNSPLDTASEYSDGNVNTLDTTLTSDFDFYQSITSLPTPRISEGSPLQQLKKFLEPYTKEELESLIMGLSNNDSKYFEMILERVKTDKKWCKLFVHGLSYQTTNETLKNFYSKFGNVVEAVVLVDKKGTSKGYGFVTFSNADEALYAVKSDKKKIDGRVTHCNLAFKGNPKKSTPVTTNVINQRASGSLNDRRLFVYSLAWKTDDESLAKAFGNYGELEEAVVIRDKKTGKSKGYGFVTFKYTESAKAALNSPEKTIDGRKTHCNFACERENQIPTVAQIYAGNAPNQLNGLQDNRSDVMFNPNLTSPMFPNPTSNPGNMMGGFPSNNNLNIPPQNQFILSRNPGNQINIGTPSIASVPLSPPNFPNLSPTKQQNFMNSNFINPQQHQNNMLLSPNPSHTPNLQPLHNSFLLPPSGGNSTGMMVPNSMPGMHNPNLPPNFGNSNRGTLPLMNLITNNLGNFTINPNTSQTINRTNNSTGATNSNQSPPNNSNNPNANVTSKTVIAVSGGNNPRNNGSNNPNSIERIEEHDPSSPRTQSESGSNTPR